MAVVATVHHREAIAPDPLEDLPVVCGDPFLEESLTPSSREEVSRSRKIVEQRLAYILKDLQAARDLTSGVDWLFQSNFNLRDLSQLVGLLQNASHQLGVLRQGLGTHPEYYACSPRIRFHFDEASADFSQIIDESVSEIDQALREPAPGLIEIRQVLKIARRLFFNLQERAEYLLHFPIEAIAG